MDLHENLEQLSSQILSSCYARVTELHFNIIQLMNNAIGPPSIAVCSPFFPEIEIEENRLFEKNNLCYNCA